MFGILHRSTAKLYTQFNYGAKLGYLGSGPSQSILHATLFSHWVHEGFYEVTPPLSKKLRFANRSSGGSGKSLQSLVLAGLVSDSLELPGGNGA